MADHHENEEHRTSPLAGILLALMLLIVVGGGISYAMGWISFSSGDGETVIEVETGEMEDAAEGAAKKGREAVEETGEALKNAGDALTDVSDDDDVDVDNADSDHDGVIEKPETDLKE